MKYCLWIPTCLKPMVQNMSATKNPTRSLKPQASSYISSPDLMCFSVIPVMQRGCPAKNTCWVVYYSLSIQESQNERVRFYTHTCVCIYIYIYAFMFTYIKPIWSRVKQICLNFNAQSKTHCFPGRLSCTSTSFCPGRLRPQ